MMLTVTHDVSVSFLATKLISGYSDFILFTDSLMKGQSSYGQSTVMNRVIKVMYQEALIPQ
jgi:hypothetical protein